MQRACDVPLQHNSYQQAAKYEVIEFALDIKGRCKRYNSMMAKLSKEEMRIKPLCVSSLLTESYKW